MDYEHYMEHKDRLRQGKRYLPSSLCNLVPFITQGNTMPQRLVDFVVKVFEFVIYLCEG